MMILFLCKLHIKPPQQYQRGGFQFPRLIFSFAKRRGSYSCFRRACAHGSRIPLRGMRQRRRFAPPLIRASALCRCTRARGGVGGVRVSESGGMAWRKPRRLRISPMLAAFNFLGLSSALPNAAVRTPAFGERARTGVAYRFAVCGRGGASRRLSFVHLHNADARVRAVGWAALE